MKNPSQLPAAAALEDADIVMVWQDGALKQTTVADLRAAVLDNLASAIIGLDLSTLPTSNPGGGRLWLNGGVVQIGA